MYYREEAAASETIGFVLLVAVFVVIAGFIGITMVTDSGDDQAPAVVISTGAYYDGDQLKLVLRNDGGDFLEKDKLQIIVEGEDVTDQFVNNDGSSDWGEWDTGGEIYLDVSEKPDDIQIVSYQNYEEPSVIYLLGSDAGKPIEVVTEIPTPVPTDVPGNPPVADFTATPLSGGAPLIVNFTDSSSNEPSSWQWDFGDGATSSEQNPTHIYSSFGTFTVTLTATNAHGDGTKTKSGYITVLPSQSCEVSGLTGYYYRSNDFTGNPVLRTDQVIRFADQEAIDRYGYVSDIADWPNPIIGRDDDFSVIYEGYLMIDKEADYTFYLTSDDGSRLWIDNTGDGDTPVVDNWDDHSPEEKSGNRHLTVGFHPLKIKMYEKKVHAVLQLEWESSDFDRIFVDSFCVDECCRPLNAGFTADPILGLAPLNVSFTDTSTGSVTGWSWDFGDGTTSTVQNPVHIFTDPGSYTVNLTVTDIYGESESHSEDIIVSAVPVCTRPGLTGYYFDNRNFEGTPVERSDERLRFADPNGVSWRGYGTDITGWPEGIIGQTEQFSVIYDGYLIIEEAGDYTFYLTSDDGSYLWIDNTDDADPPLIDNGGYHIPEEKSATTYLAAGCHPVKVKMFENNGMAVLHLEWSSSAIARTYDIPLCQDDACQSGPAPAAWWTFDEASGSTAIDSSGNDNDGSIQGTYSRMAGACGDALYFDGVTTYISVPDSATLDASDKVTLCAWIYPELPINKSGIWDEYRNTISVLDKGDNGDGNYEFFMKKTDTVSRFTFESVNERLDHLTGVPYEYNRWQHLACVVDTGAGTGTVYIDGASVGTFDTPSSLVPNDEPVYIGMQKISGGYPDWATFNFKGKLDEVMLYTTALTAGQVQEIYGKCTPVPAPVADFSADTTTGSAPLTVTFTDLSTNAPDTWFWDFGDGTVSIEENPQHKYTLNGVYNVSLRAGNAGGYDTEVKTSFITVTGLPSPAGWWKFDEGSGGTATDSSGNDNDGSIKGTYSRVDGACGDGLYFDGTSTYVLVPNDDTLDAPDYLSYAAWLMPEPPVIPDDMDVTKFLNFTSLICKGSQDEDNYELFIRNLNGGTELSFETEYGGYKEYSTTGFGYEYGQWQHVAFVADTDTGVAKLYINGESAGTVTSSLPDSFDTNDDALTIGMQQMYSPYLFRYKGVMDEVMLYTIALTDDQVREIYDTCTPPPAPVADFTADTTSGNAPLTVTFTDSSTNSPASWLWDFGDGETSTEENPSHTYSSAGTYDVTLTVTGTGGQSTKTYADMITVNPTSSDIHDVVFISDNSKDATLKKDYYLEFTVEDTGDQYIIPTISIENTDNGKTIVDGYILESGDIVRFELSKDIRDGSVFISGTSLWQDGFNITDVDVYVNGNSIGKEGLPKPYVPKFSGLKSTLVLETKNKVGWTQLSYDGETIIFDYDGREVTLNGLTQSEGSGVFNLRLIKNSDSYFDGGISSYSLDK
ncbi:PKD domain-containing protein [Methanoplanus endosymbiosus]|uniref:PKD domain-containing protein n=1 Tax=Methanoplanus endosymbiosus TaxID=33865 RepID=UPI0027E36132|nr:PKD domain-containing protein [Methanoplanus endosymbiosus]